MRAETASFSALAIPGWRGMESGILVLRIQL